MKTRNFSRHQRLNNVDYLAICVLGIISLFIGGDALAAGNSADWVKPGVAIIEGLKSGVVTIGALVIGLGVMVVGVWACASLRMEWSKIGYVFIGGVLIIAGPKMVETLMSLASS